MVIRQLIILRNVRSSPQKYQFPKSHPKNYPVVEKFLKHDYYLENVFQIFKHGRKKSQTNFSLLITLNVKNHVRISFLYKKLAR
jgi:hypothetical protein